jgi:hypothetical protein
MGSACSSSPSFPKTVPDNIILLGKDENKTPTFNIAYCTEQGSEDAYNFAKLCIQSLFKKAIVNPQKIHNKTGYFELKYVDEFGSEILVFSRKNGEGNFSKEKCCMVMAKIKRTVR